MVVYPRVGPEPRENELPAAQRQVLTMRYGSRVAGAWSYGG
jgi:hypothetical protein